jgi:hypothetical protein
MNCTDFLEFLQGVVTIGDWGGGGCGGHAAASAPGVEGVCFFFPKSQWLSIYYVKLTAWNNFENVLWH